MPTDEQWNNFLDEDSLRSKNGIDENLNNPNVIKEVIRVPNLNERKDHG